MLYEVITIDDAKSLIDTKSKLMERLETKMAFYAETLRFEVV